MCKGRRERAPPPTGTPLTGAPPRLAAHLSPGPRVPAPCHLTGPQAAGTHVRGPASGGTALLAGPCSRSLLARPSGLPAPEADHGASLDSCPTLGRTLRGAKRKAEGPSEGAAGDQQRGLQTQPWDQDWRGGDTPGGSPRRGPRAGRTLPGGSLPIPGSGNVCRAVSGGLREGGLGVGPTLALQSLWNQAVVQGPMSQASLLGGRGGPVAHSRSFTSSPLLPTQRTCRLRWPRPHRTEH